MLYNTLHNRVLRLILAVGGELITAAGINLFIVPLGLYSGGTLGVCQLIRTFLQSQLGLDLGTSPLWGARASRRCWRPCGPIRRRSRRPGRSAGTG